MELLDCTIRDGGYINNWLFAPEVVDSIYKAANNAGIKYVEIGYIEKVNSFYVNKLDSKIIVMMDYKKREIVCDKNETNIDGIRVAVHKTDIYDAIKFTTKLKAKGYFAGIQMMGITNYKESELKELSRNIDDLDYLSIADSNGSLLPNDIKKIISIFEDSDTLIGFHSHNNMQLSFANAITAMESGVDIIDCTFEGIGRGAGNLPTELFLSYLNKYKNGKYKLAPILNAIDKYILPLRASYKWGYNIPNMLSGMEQIHPYYGRDASKYKLVKTLEIVERIGVDKPMKYNGKRKIVCVIPARYKSSRFPGKPLELINGKTLLQRVYDNAMTVDLFDEVVIATDDTRIAESCKKLKMNYLMTSSDCKTGTDRLAEVSNIVDAYLYINLQGDECLILPETITSFVRSIVDSGSLDRVAFNGATDCDDEDFKNINVPKIVTDMYGDLLYISRLPIPYKKSDYSSRHFKELGLHAYTKKGLSIFSSSEQLEAEKTEQIEFLRFLEAGKKVRVIYMKMPFKNHAVDVPSDIQIVEEIFEKQSIE